MLRQGARCIRRAVLQLALIITIALAGAWPGAGQSTAPPRTEKDVDFWQPLWMQRELWGPGKMPPGMRARLLRHTTYLQYGAEAVSGSAINGWRNTTGHRGRRQALCPALCRMPRQAGARRWGCVELLATLPRSPRLHGSAAHFCR